MIKHVIDHEEHDCDLDLEDSQPLLKVGGCLSVVALSKCHVVPGRVQ